MVGSAGALGTALSAGAVTPWLSRDAEAQIEPIEPVQDVPPGSYEPSLDGADRGIHSGGEALELPATPVAIPENLPPAPTWEPTDAGMATSLGGSDIAVASEGGSHQVDAPKRKVDKILGKKNRP